MDTGIHVVNLVNIWHHQVAAWTADAKRYDLCKYLVSHSHNSSIHIGIRVSAASRGETAMIFVKFGHDHF